MQPTPTWGQFYAEQRMLPYARRARDVGNLSRTGAELIERVTDRLIAGASTTAVRRPGSMAICGQAT